VSNTHAVLIHELDGGVVQITMHDRASKNTFSDELVGGLLAAFDAVRASVSCKAVVLTGYDTYFASGGTRQSLLALQAGAARFSDTNLYSLPLECPVPVIAAMQGHGIGGGLVFGLFSDLVIMSRESVYAANFMKYGFTPGMGATLIMPHRLGNALAAEMLLSAQTYRGEDLARRGVPFDVLPRAAVLERAHRLAHELADKPRGALIDLKSHLVERLRHELAHVVSKEEAMHQRSFHQQEVRERILTLFGS
jgi:polyketide biosynthesis enoyl-CoA hydratase PksI